MKRIITLFLLFLLQKGFAQTAVYTFNNGGNFLSETEVKASFETVQKSLPSNLALESIIYHKVFKKDTTINYLAFNVNKVEPGQPSSGFKLSYKQDSTFLLLNKKLPGFKLKELNGQTISSAQFSGKPALINFWAIYCGPCIAEMPQLSMLKDKYKDRMNFISITENIGSTDNLTGFLADKKFNFQVLENGQAYKDALKIRALPKNIFIDRNGVVRFIQGNYPLGANSTPAEIDDVNNYFTKIIEELIKEK